MQPAYEINGRACDANDFYARACDPARHVAVEACAGAGKTWMLVERIVRALEQGCEAREILAITFTRKAAAEMRVRLDQRLREDSPDLHVRLLRQGVMPQVRTFHGWFAQLLMMAPVSVLEELGLPARFSLVEDDTALVAQVWRRFHAWVLDDAPLLRDLRDLVSSHGRHQAREALEKSLSRRSEFALADVHGVLEDAVPSASQSMPVVAGCEDPTRWLTVDELREPLRAGAQALSGAGAGKVAQRQALALSLGMEHDDVDQVVLALLTKSGERRKLGDDPRIQAAQDVAMQLAQALSQEHGHAHHARMTRLTRALTAQYQALKREQGLVDMVDVERAAHRVLSDEALGAWLQQRLDAKVRQLLIDEFQDTNPMQWQALWSWLSSYAGAGGGDAPVLFIVGDPKQSIYRFRRAEPQVFRAAQSFLREGLNGDLLSCDHTRRCAPQVVQLVNSVMLEAQAGGEYQGFRAHSTHSEQQGQLLALPLIERPPRTPKATRGKAEDAAQDATDRSVLDLPWRDGLTTPRELEEDDLRQRETRQAAQWIDSRLAAGDVPGDFMVLARKRDRLGDMADALRRIGIAHVLAEKHALIDAPEIQDLVGLIDALVSPGQDISLARALKSPLFGFDDAQLLHVARASARNGANWLASLAECELRDFAGRPVHVVLDKWARWLRELPPHDAIQALFDDADVLGRYAAAVPAAQVESALAHLRCLPGAALEVGGGRYLDAYSFVRALRAGEGAAQAQAHPHAVRLLTIHGAKGLEAPHVLILDTDALPARAESMSALIDWPGEEQAPRSFAFVERESRIAPSAASLLADEQAARNREELNALYVAMTRASRTLVISAVAAPRDPGRSWWRRLLAHVQLVPDASEPLTDRLHPAAETGLADGARQRRLPVLPSLSRSLAAGLAPVERGETVPARQPIGAASDGVAARRGSALHRLLEWLPMQAQAGGYWPPWQLHAIGVQFDLDLSQVQELAQAATRMREGEAAWAWDAKVVDVALAEVECVHRGQVMRFDRLVRRQDDGCWWVLDFKSSTQPETQAELLVQLGTYRQALLELKAPQPVRAAFVSVDGRLIELP